jgi:hypothetical protein
MARPSPHTSIATRLMVMVLLRFGSDAGVGQWPCGRLRRQRPGRFRCLVVRWIVGGRQRRREDDAAERGRACEQEN